MFKQKIIFNQIKNKNIFEIGVRKVEEKLKALEGITFREWQKVKSVVDNAFAEIKDQNTLTVNKNVLEHLKVIS